MATKENTTNSDNQNQDSKHVSVVYFHGMGNQRRYEEVSRLVDSLDTYTTNRFNEGQKLGILAEIKPQIEISRSIESENITYIQALYKTKPGKSNPVDSTVRFYEVYWAPILAEGASSYKVLKWMFSTILRPIQNLITPWRERQRIRRVSLLKLREKMAVKENTKEASDYSELFEAYNKFERLDSIREHTKGSINEFKTFIGNKFKDEHDKVLRLQKLALQWHYYSRLNEYWYLFLLITLALFLITAFGLSLALIAMVLEWATSIGLSNYLMQHDFGKIAEMFKPNLGNIVSVFLGFVSLVGLTKFLSHYMGDVYQWTTYEETDTKNQRRKAILKKGIDTMAHVLGDDACKRVVVVGHSLGTAVAHDTLLSLMQQNRAHNEGNSIMGPVPLFKIEHLITIASPIDKIHYLFESFRTKYHRYRRVIDNLRGDIGTSPFSVNGNAHIKWLNYWDKGDIVSSELWTPSNRENSELNVENVEVSQFDFPEPGSSHLAYFKDRKVIGDLYAVIFWRAYSFIAEPANPTLVIEYEKTQPRCKLGMKPIFYRKLIITFPYVLIVCLGLRFFNVPDIVQSMAYVLTSVMFVVIVIGYLMSIKKGHLNSI